MRIFLIICVLAVAFQPINAQDHSQKFIDSVQHKYLDKGAKKYSYFSPKWQMYLDSALAITPENDYLWQQKAMPMFKARKYEVGMKYIDKAVLLNPEEHLDYRAFIKCIFSKQYRASLKDFKKALVLNGDIGLMDHPYRFYMGLCHLQLNEFEKAKQLFLEVLQEDYKENGSDSTAHPLRYFYTGIVYLELGYNLTAEKYFKLSIKNYEKFSDAKYYLYTCLARQGKRKLADEYLMQAKSNFMEGYTVSEDQRFYETYPYQIKKWFFK